MIYPPNIESKIGFSEIRKLISDYCISPMGEEYVDKIKMSSDYQNINNLLSQTAEFKNILMLEEGFPAKNFFDLRKPLLRLKTEGTFISLEDLHDLNISLHQLNKIRHYFNDERFEKYPNIAKLVNSVQYDNKILNEIHLIVDDKGRMRENASEDLRSIRRKIITLNSGIRNKAQSFMQMAVRKGWAREGSELSVRNNRMVLPLEHTHKRKIKGFVHDESSSGQTVYIEPAELFETNNQIRELQIEENKEIKRILLKLSDKIRPLIQDLLKVYNLLGIIDFVRAKSLLAVDLNGVFPTLSEKPNIVWNEAYHPLLLLSYKEKGKLVVPQDIKMSSEKNMLIISGPNAGGKSVTLKTIALNQYMLQCGILIPLKSTSEVGIFNELFIDIGDEQSLEDDLSTYSSHLSNINYFSENLSSKSLILIDEFGSGTEPDLGGAIAEASLKYFYENNSFVVVTTHYANLKEFANKNNRAVNAAMMYNTEKLEPMFRMKIGKPGSSFAFEIAKKIGLKKNLLKYATDIIGKERIDFDTRLQELEIEKENLIAKNKQLSSADNVLTDTIDKYKNLSNKIKADKTQILKDAKKEAKEIVLDANKLIEKAIKDIKEANAEKKATKRIRENLQEDIDKLSKTQSSKSRNKASRDNNEPQKVHTRDTSKKLSEGDYVKIINQSGVGQIEKIKNNSAEVNFDNMKLSISLDKLVATNKKKSKINRGNTYSDLYRNKSNDFNPSLDIRGKRADEAITEVLNWFDDAVMLGEYNLEILHGKGNGILRNLVRDALSKNNEVSSLKDAPIDRGGAGITIVERRK